MYTVDGGPVFRSAFVLNEEKASEDLRGIVKKKKRKELEPYCEQFFALFRATYLQPKEKMAEANEYRRSHIFFFPQFDSINERIYKTGIK